MSNTPLVFLVPLVRSLIRFSKRTRLPGFEGVPLFDVIRFFYLQVKKVGINERSAAISFNFIMAIPPACIFLFSLVPLLPVADLFYKEVVSFVRDLSPNSATRRIVIDFLDDFFRRPKNSLLSVGFLISLFFSSNAVLGIINSFNRSIHEKESKILFGKRWKAIKLTFIIILIFIASMLLLMTQGALFRWILDMLNINNNFVKWMILVLRWIVIVGLFFYSIAFIYRHAPSVEKKWPLVSPGSILACTLIILFTFLFSFWINKVATFSIYGSIGTILILMIFIRVISQVLLIGFELNVSIKSLKAESDKRQKADINGAQ
jgi:membrane protein